MKICLLAILLTAVLSCQDSDTHSEYNSETRQHNANPRVIARIGTEQITYEEVLKEIKKLPYKQKTLYLSNPSRFNEFVESYVNRKLLYNEATKQGYEHKEDIKEQIKTFKNKVIAKSFVKDLLKTFEIEPKTIEKYYDDNKNKYEQRYISTIRIQAAPGNPGARQDAKLRAEALWGKLKSGEDFNTLTNNFETQSTLVNRGQYPKQINEVIFNLAKGEISNPLEVENGYIIIKADKEIETVPIAQVKRKIESALIKDKLDEYMQSISEDWEVTVYKERIKEIISSENNTITD